MTGQNGAEPRGECEAEHPDPTRVDGSSSISRVASGRSAMSASSDQSHQMQHDGLSQLPPVNDSERRDTAGCARQPVAHTQLTCGYLTAVTRSEVVVVLEQVEKFFFRVTDRVWLGGNTLRPAAMTGLHWDAEKLPVSTTPTDALCCVPGASATVPNLDCTRDAGLPICLPLLVTADTPG
jgi:hypothetical protein